MHKRPKNKYLLDFILSVTALVMVGLTMLGLMFPLVTSRYQVGPSTTLKHFKVGNWCEHVDALQNSRKIAGWNVARVSLIITLILLGLLTAALLIKFLINHPVLNWGIIVASGLCAVAALTFLIALVVGGNAFASKDVLGGTFSYMPNFGAYAVTFGTLIVAGLAIWVARPRKIKLTSVKI